MYDNFFGFKERPFQLVPNPDYLFLSKSHEEAIAHLKYAISHGDGFVELTGEVGTGKTTLCRAFLENLDENCEVAYIFNPQLNSLELLRAINDEFDIDSTPGNAKDLIDRLNAFLMEKKAQKKHVVLLIDEAQNLNKEALEQLRLLSNLETNTSKLLQIILVGQPELQKILDAYELRQLRQRITLSWYLTPLSRKETREYIRHRVNIAAQKTGDRFSSAAYRRIYKYSGGIPRLINIACDRALLTAFGLSRQKVTSRIARSSINELRNRGGYTPRILTPARVFTGLAVVFCLAVIAAFLLKMPPLFDVKPGIVRPAVDPAPVNDVSTRFEQFLGNLASRPSRFMAAKTVISLWETTPGPDRYLNNIDDDDNFFQFAAARGNLEMLTVAGDWELILKLNLPAVLEFVPPGAIAPRYLTFIEMKGEEILLKGGEKNQSIRVTPVEMQSYWTGKAYIPWKNFLNYSGDIPLDAPPESVFTLKMLLLDIGYREIKLDRVYDDAARDVVKKIQHAHGIDVDGIVGAQTKIVIYNEKKDLTIPHLRLPTAY